MLYLHKFTNFILSENYSAKIIVNKLYSIINDIILSYLLYQIKSVLFHGNFHVNFHAQLRFSAVVTRQYRNRIGLV